MILTEVLKTIRNEEGLFKYSEELILKAERLLEEGGEWIYKDDKAILIANHSKQLQYDGRLDEVAIELDAIDVFDAIKVEEMVNELSDESILGLMPRIENLKNASVEGAIRILNNGAKVIREFNVFKLMRKDQELVRLTTKEIVKALRA